MAVKTTPAASRVGPLCPCPQGFRPPQFRHFPGQQLSPSPCPCLRWHGQVSESEKISRLKSATAFVAPALRGESFGVVLLEAMASSTAVIASDIPGYRNVATNGTDAVLVEPGNAVELASAIKAVLTDTAYRDHLVAEGLKTAASMSMDRLATLYEERYRMVLNSRA